MENLTELKRRVIEYLTGLAAFENAAVVPAYPEKQRAFPLTKPVVTVEIAGVALSSAGLGGYLGEGDAELYGAFALITLRFGIYHAETDGCQLLFESLCNALFDSDWLGIQKSGCERIGYDAKTAAYLLPAEAVLKTAWITPKQEERLFNEIYLKDVKA